jgi:Zn finger protein HypA/HybF involved in hydrogenase expression
LTAGELSAILSVTIIPNARGAIVKAKMSNKPSEAATYLCNKCNTQFNHVQGKLVCPSCSNTNKTDLVVISIKDDPDENQLYTEDDFLGG